MHQSLFNRVLSPSGIKHSCSYATVIFSRLLTLVLRFRLLLVIICACSVVLHIKYHADTQETNKQLALRSTNPAKDARIIIERAVGLTSDQLLSRYGPPTSTTPIRPGRCYDDAFCGGDEIRSYHVSHDIQVVMIMKNRTCIMAYTDVLDR